MKAIFLDVGHGKNAFGFLDQGACRVYNDHLFRERDFAKEIVRRMKALLDTKEELKGCLIQTVGLETDATPGAKMGFVNHTIRENRFTPSDCLSVSIHMNSSISMTPNGHEVWYQKAGGAALALANSMVAAWKEYNILPLRPTPVNSTASNSKWHRLYIDDAICPAVLVETGFISHYDDAITVQNNFDRVAEALCHGILEYIRNKQ